MKLKLRILLVFLILLCIPAFSQNLIKNDETCKDLEEIIFNRNKSIHNIHFDKATYDQSLD